jgi:hypothetical protein
MQLQLLEEQRRNRFIERENHSFCVHKQPDSAFELTEKMYTKMIRRKSCTNQLFGGINSFELKTYNLKVPKSAFYSKLKISKSVKFTWKSSNGIKIPKGRKIKKEKKQEKAKLNSFISSWGKSKRITKPSLSRIRSS